MTWIATPESSSLAGFDYDKDKLVLTVEFKNGGRYSYFDVPEVVFERMKTAQSRGQFLAQTLRIYIDTQEFERKILSTDVK